MPVKRSYDVETSNSQYQEHIQPLLIKNQEYFKSYICMVLVTLIICSIFFLIALFIAHNKNQNINNGDKEGEFRFNALEVNSNNSSTLQKTLEHASTTKIHHTTTPITTIVNNRTTSSSPISLSNSTEFPISGTSLTTKESTTYELYLPEKLNSYGSNSDYTSTSRDIISTTSDVTTFEEVSHQNVKEIQSTTLSNVTTIDEVTDSMVKEIQSTTLSDVTTTDEVTNPSVKKIQSTTLSNVTTTDEVTDSIVKEIQSTTLSDVTTTDEVTNPSVKKIQSTTLSDITTTGEVTDPSVKEIQSITLSAVTTTDEVTDPSVKEILFTTLNDATTTNEITYPSVNEIKSTTLNDVTTTDEYTDPSVKEIYSTTSSGTTRNDIVSDSILKEIYKTTPSGATTTDEVSTVETVTKISSSSNSTTSSIESAMASIDDSNSTALNICQSKSCYSTATRLVNLIDNDVDKCNNFYDFACGQRHTVRSNEEMLQNFNYDVFKKSLNKINNSSDEGKKRFLQFYKSCIEHDPLLIASNLSQIYEIVKQNVGNGFIFNDNDTILANEKHISQLLSKMILLNHAPLFDVDFVLDENQKYIFKVIPPKFQIDSTIKAKCKFEYEFKLRNLATLTEYYKDCIGNHSYTDVYIQHMETILNAVNVFDDIHDATKKDYLLKEIGETFISYYEFYQNVLEKVLDLKYSERAQGISECSEDGKLYEGKVEEWNTEFNDSYSVNVNWIYLFQSLVGKNITSDSKVQVYFKSFLFDLFGMNITVKAMNNLLVATFLRDYYIELMLTDQQCLEKTIQLHPEVASNIYNNYLERNISKMQNVISSIFDDIKITFNKTVNNAPFDLNVKKDMSTILNGIQLEFYKPFRKSYNESHTCDTYLDCFIYASKEFRRYKYQAWNQNIADFNYIWFHTVRVYEMNPVAVYQAHKIAIPYGMFYGYNSNLDKLPSYLLMSTIGRKLAYHLASYFSVIGLAFLRQKFNNTIRYLHDTDVSCGDASPYKVYDNDILSCIKKRYEDKQNLEIKSKTVYFQVYVEYLLNQIISDSSAIRLAYDTAFDQKTKRSDQKLPWIKADYTDEQLFYISAVQEFCDSSEDDLFTFSNKLYLDGMLPKQLRVIDFLKSDTTFASVFNCPNGTTYNPDLKCSIFPYIEELESEPTEIPLSDRE